MIEQLNNITKQLNELEHAVRSDKSLPHSPLATTIAFNEARIALVALDVALHARHNERHPRKPIPVDLSPSEPLDAETRAEIDSTP